MILGAMLGLVAAKFYRISIILSTSIQGGAFCGIALPMVAGMIPDLTFVIIASAIIAVLGVFVQCKTNKGPAKDNEKKEAKKVVERMETKEKEETQETPKAEAWVDVVDEKPVEVMKAEEKTQEEQKQPAEEPQISVKMLDIEKLQKVGTEGIAAVIAWSRVFFSMKNGKDLMTKLTSHAQQLMVILLVLSMGQYLWGWSYYAVQPAPFGAALALLAAKDKFKEKKGYGGKRHV